MNPRPRSQGPRLARRQLLQLGLGSLGLTSLPLLRPRESRALASDAPQRLVLVFSPNGTVPDAFWPTPSTTESDFTLGEITQPFEPFKDRLLFLKGLNQDVALIGPGGPHQKGVGGLFTNSELQEGTFVDGDGRMSGWANGISVDQEAARTVGQVTHLPSLELGVRAIDNEVRARISYAGPGNPMPPMNSPLAAYERLFSGFVGLDAAKKAQFGHVIGAVNQQYATLVPRLSRADQIKLEQNLEMIAAIERRMALASSGACVSPAAPPDRDPDNETTMPDIAESHVELLAAAFGCDLTRVASVQFSSAINEIRMPWVDSLGTGHALSHSGASDADARRQMVACHKWMAEKIVSLMDRLSRIPEGEGSVLDHTLIVWGNELGEGSSHSHTDIPFLVAGGGGGFRMGRFLQYAGVSHGSLLTSLLRAMGVERDSFGHPDVTSSPLSGLI